MEKGKKMIYETMGSIHGTLEEMAGYPCQGEQLRWEEQHGIRPEPVNTCGPATDSNTRISALGMRAADEPAIKPSPADLRREQIIHSMCMTRRHDYAIPINDIHKTLPGIACGMTHEDRKFLFNEMAQLYEHHVAPILKDLDQCNGSLNKAVGQTMTQKRQIEKLTADLKDPNKIHEYMGKRLDYWLELEACAGYGGEVTKIRYREYERLINAKYELKQIAEKLKIKPDTPIAVILDTIQSMKQHAERYRANLQNQSIAGLEADNHSMKEQLGLIRAALKRAGINETTPEHVSVTDLATRYLQAKKLSDTQHQILMGTNSIMACPDCHAVEGALGRPAGTAMDVILADIARLKDRADSVARMLLPQKGEAATTADVMVEIQRLQDAAKPVYGPSPVWTFLQNNGQLIKTILRIGEALELPTPYQDDAMVTEITRLQKGQMQRAYMEMKQAFEDSEKGRVEATRKVKALRNIVQRNAPHTRDCCPALGQACNCWKAEFMAEADRP